MQMVDSQLGEQGTPMGRGQQSSREKDFRGPPRHPFLGTGNTGGTRWSHPLREQRGTESQRQAGGEDANAKA